MAVFVSDNEGAPASMAESVTRHAQNPPAGNFQYLICGIDSIYFGIYVVWSEEWEQIFRVLEYNKQKAQGTDGFLEESTPGRKYLFLPGGMAPNYRYHLKFNEYSLFLSKTRHAKRSPRVCLERF